MLKVLWTSSNGLWRNTMPDLSAVPAQAGGILRFEHGEVRMGDVLIPGVLKALSIAGRVRFDDAQVEGASGKTKTATGWEDADIALSMELLSDDESNCYSKLARINAIFKGIDSGSNPKVYDVVNAHAISRGIDQVVFASLDSAETDEDDVITATLNFTEHIPIIREKEKQVIASDKAKGTAPKTTESESEPEPDAGITKDIGPFAAGYQAGAG